MTGIKMSQGCFHVRVRDINLWDMSGGVAAATCFDSVASASVAQGGTSWLLLAAGQSEGPVKLLPS